MFVVPGAPPASADGPGASGPRVRLARCRHYYRSECSGGAIIRTRTSNNNGRLMRWVYFRKRFSFETNCIVCATLDKYVSTKKKRKTKKSKNLENFEKLEKL